ncbi:ABC1 family protein [Flavobacteriaceae bacterium MAR_2010_188]|nr:ABC1 family protein [Flavobacteriaceae bacterium MAR_2010_188]
MKTIDKIPVSKIQRATKLVSTGAKVGVNYLKYYGDRLMTDEIGAKDRLNQNNADDIYDSLKQLKGSALKVAQMLSMEKSIMPQAYVEKFSLAQFSVPPLSPPLVIKTFKKYFGKHPNEIFDYFNATSVNAASIGQVHIAEKDGKKLAVKIQYPGVAQSISSDLALVKPIAMSMFNLKGGDSDKYFKEVENKLIEETDYYLELAQSMAVVKACSNIPNLQFPKYYENLSNERIITMDYMFGKHLSELNTATLAPETATILGQALWDFYMFQIHKLRKVHADPHPGNFLISEDNKLIALDFGCMKEIPDSFYVPYFEMTEKKYSKDQNNFKNTLTKLEILRADDTPEEVEFFTEIFSEMLELFTKPFQTETFDFADPSFFDKIREMAEKYSNSTELRKMNANRGSKHFIYINRTFFGLYNLMFDLKATNIKINNYLNI